MASPTQWTWVWINSRSWWWTGRPGMLQSMGSQKVRQDWATELNWWVKVFFKSNLTGYKLYLNFIACKIYHNNLNCFIRNEDDKIANITFLKNMCSQLLSLVFVTPWTVACQAPLSMGFSRQEYWSGLPFSPPSWLRDWTMSIVSPALHEDSLLLAPSGKALEWTIRKH